MRSAVAIGNFDGLHLGHMRLIAALTKRASELGLPSYAYTFRDHPQNVISGACGVRLITDFDKKLDIFSETGIDGVYAERFDKNFAAVAPEDFIRDTLVGKFGVRLVAIGPDFRFGRGGGGDAGMLREYGRRYGFIVETVGQASVFEGSDGVAEQDAEAGRRADSGQRRIISSSYIRRLIMSGRTRDAAISLGRLFSMKGRVLAYPAGGKFPSAVPGAAMVVIYPDKLMAAPSPGFYSAYVRAGRSARRCLVNVDNIAGKTAILVRADDMSHDLHGAEIEIFFYKRIYQTVRNGIISGGK
jgi:riboflavin kinase/FMN adenylyltransferase